jgi:hypothetical protein
MKTPSFDVRKPQHALWLLLLPFVLTGCGGFTATKTISPLDFLLPGLHLRVDPPQPLVPEGTNTLVCWHDASALQNLAVGTSAVTQDNTVPATP